MQEKVRHTAPVFIRSAAFVSLVLLLTVRFGALMHTHADNHTCSVHHYSSPDTDSPLTLPSSTVPHTDDTNDTHTESCPLCDYLTTPHSAATLGQRLIFCIGILALVLLNPVVISRTHSPLARLADRAPPTFSPAL